MLIVDGSNVPNPLRPWHRRAWSAPWRLVTDLARLTRDWIACVDLLFDGPPRGGIPDGGIIEGIRVFYSWSQPADHRVVSLVIEHRTAGDDAVVVTSDRALAARAAALGADVVSSETLRIALDRVGGASHLGVGLRSPLLVRPDALVALDRPKRRVESAQPVVP